MKASSTRPTATGSLVTLSAADDFARRPVGCATASDHALFWLPVRDLLLIAVWGQLDGSDYALFERLAPAWLGDDAPRRRSILDLRGLTGVAPDAMGHFVTFTIAHRQRYLDTLGACGLVVEPAALLTAAIIAGLPTMAAAPSPFQVFTGPLEALAALGVDDPTLGATFAALRAEAAARSGSREALARWLQANLHDARLQRAARDLALSTRTLQRRLADSGTSFRQELEHARVLEAQRLLATTDAKIEVIAHTIGLQKPQHLAALFRRRVGTTPSAWRQQRHDRPTTAPRGDVTPEGPAPQRR